MDEQTKEVEMLEKAFTHDDDANAQEEIKHRAQVHLTALRRRMDALDAAQFQPRRHSWMLRLAAAAAAVVLLLLAGQSVFTRSGHGIAFANVIRNIETFRPFSCLFQLERPKRTDSYRSMHYSPTQRREESPSGMVRILDLAANVEREGQTAQAIVLLELRDQTAKQEVWYGTSKQDPDLLSILNGMRENHQELGVRRVDGRTCSGFRSVSEFNDITIWADNETELPVRVEIIHPQFGQKIHMSEFRFDVVFDPALFSTEPPAGYSVERIEHDEPVKNFPEE